LSNLFFLFLNNLSPILLIAGSGYGLGKRFRIDPRTFSQVVFYFFSPCLVFNSLAKNQLSESDFLSVAGFAVAMVVIVGLLSWGIGSALRLERHILAAVMITSMFDNAGNLGLSITSFAFDSAALASASVIFVIYSSLTNTLGAVIASMGKSGLRKAVLILVKMPALYALILGILFSHQGWKLPLFLDRGISMAANATIPCMLILLGVQLERARWTGHKLALTTATSLRLLVAPLIAIGLSAVFGLHGPTRQASILEASMPSAVLCTILATEFDVEPAFVTSVVFVTTILSPLTITPLLSYLGG
jgi:malate permease and related proteins